MTWTIRIRYAQFDPPKIREGVSIWLYSEAITSN
jgi:hypothetical protein